MEATWKQHGSNVEGTWKIIEYTNIEEDGK